MKTKILYEDDDVLVCRKPSGLATQSASGFQEDMVSELKNYIWETTGEREPYLGLVHRLDQPVEGLLVCGRNRAAAAGLSRQLESGALRKAYLAVAEGVLPEREGTLTDYLKRDGRSNLSVIARKGERDARYARLTYRLLAAGKDCSLVRIELGTGRRHQIRAQLAHFGYPLRNDGKYGKSGATWPCRRERSGGEEPGRPALALCAYSLSFVRPSDRAYLRFAVSPENPAFGEFSAELARLERASDGAEAGGRDESR